MALRYLAALAVSWKVQSGVCQAGLHLPHYQ